MTKRRAQRKRGQRKARLAAASQVQGQVSTQTITELLDKLVTLQSAPADWHSPWNCPICDTPQNWANYICERCRDQAFWIGELMYSVLGIPWASNEYGFLPPWAWQALQAKTNAQGESV